MRRILVTLTATAMLAGGVFATSLPAPANATGAAKVRVTDVGFTFVPGAPDDTFAGEVTAAAVVENPTTKVATDVEVTLTLQDKSGRPIMDDRKTLSYIAPGDEAYAVWQTTYPETKVPAKIKAAISDPGELVSQAAFADDMQYELMADGPVAVDDLAVEFDDLRYHDDGILSSIVGNARSATGEELAGLDVTCAAFESGTPVGGGFEVLRVIPQGSDAGIQAGGLQGGLEPDDLRCSARIEYLEQRIGTLADQLVVHETGFSLIPVIDNYTFAAVVENPTDKWAWNVEVLFDVLDAQGHVIGTSTSDGSPTALGPHQTVAIASGPSSPSRATTYAGTPAQLRVRADAQSFHRPGRDIRTQAGYDPAAWTFEIANLRFGDHGLEGTITNTSKKAINAVDIVCGLYRGGALIGGIQSVGTETEFDGTLEPGVPTSFEIGSGTESSLGADRIECIAAPGENSDV